MTTIPCQYEGCTRRTKEPFKFCFICNQKDKIDCVKKCGRKTSKEYPICYTCNMETKHPCIKCKKMTNRNYLKCFTCNQEKKILKSIAILVDESDESDDEPPLSALECSVSP
jgi:hypothetical protein